MVPPTVALVLQAKAPPKPQSTPVQLCEAALQFGTFPPLTI